MKRITFLFFLALCLQSQSLHYYFQPEKVLAFARYLMREGDWLRAASELERYCRLKEGNVSANVLYDLAFCYEKAKEYEKALKVYSKLVLKREGEFSEKAAWQKALLLFNLGRKEEALKFLQHLGQGRDLKSPFVKLRLYLLVDLKRYRDALSAVDSLQGEREEKGFLKGLIKEGIQLPKKSPLKAAILSSLVPGAGKIYAGRSLDGIYSFLVISTSIWQAYSGFRDNGWRSFKGWFFTGLSLFFYSGNIYGSAAAAKIYNFQLERNYKKKFAFALGFEF